MPPPIVPSPRNAIDLIIHLATCFRTIASGALFRSCIVDREIDGELRDLEGSLALSDARNGRAQCPAVFVEVAKTEDVVRTAISRRNFRSPTR
jgi:hypothetical protein